MFTSMSSINLFLGVKTIWWVLRTSKDNLLHCNHSCIFLQSPLSWRHNTFISLPVMNILVSSAIQKNKLLKHLSSHWYTKQYGTQHRTLWYSTSNFFTEWFIIIICYTLHSICVKLINSRKLLYCKCTSWYLQYPAGYPEDLCHDK